TLTEEEKLLDDGLVRFDVQPVGQFVQRSMAGLFTRVDVERMDGDFADTRGRLRLRAERGGDCEPEEREKDGFHRMRFEGSRSGEHRQGDGSRGDAERRRKADLHLLSCGSHQSPEAIPWTVTEAAGSKSSPEACSPENRRS